MVPQQTALSKSDDIAGLAQHLESAFRGDVEIIEPLGQGRMAVVYIARQPALDRQIVVKVLKPRHARDGKAVARFKRDARAMAGCPHPGIVPVHTVGETDIGIPFFTMDYIKGETLKDRIERKGKIPLQETVRIITRLADALAAAHATGLVHRDVKPANVLLEFGTGRVLLTDFGLAKLNAGQMGGLTLTGQGEIIGEPAYLSPEQAERGQVDARSDQYSLGVIAYQMLSGQLPFPGPTPQEYIEQQAQDTPPSLLRVEPGLPTEVARVIDKALMKEPGARFSSIDAFGEALRSAVNTAAQTPERESGGNWWRHERRMLQTVAVYAGVAWGVLESLTWMLETFSLPMELRQWGFWLTVGAFPLVLGLVWAHGSRSTGDKPRHALPQASRAT